MKHNSKKKSNSNQVTTSFLTPEELEKYKERKGSNKGKRPADWRWPQNRK